MQDKHFLFRHLYKYCQGRVTGACLLSGVNYGNFSFLKWLFCGPLVQLCYVLVSKVTTYLGAVVWHREFAWLLKESSPVYT